MGKMRYSEAKHDDKFHEALSAAWERAEPYLLPVGIAVGALLVVIAVWMVASRYHTATGEKPWIERFDLSQQLAQSDEPDPEAQATRVLDALNTLVKNYQGHDAAAITLLELAQGHLGLASARSSDDPKAATSHLEQAAQAAEQFIADHPDHPLVPLAHYDAGKAHLDLGHFDPAADHFERARATRITFLAALARLQAGLCYEKTGQLDKARQAYQALRTDATAAWCAEQAEFHLAKLKRSAHKGS